MDIRKILLVEDHESSRRAMNRILTMAGFHVVEAATVAEGIALVDGQAFALLDLHLPDGDGTAVFEAIREHAPQTKVAFVTAADRLDESLRNLLSKPPDALFRKPIDMAGLLRWLNVSE
jgi:two-component system KDP operon response regulator KdpE